MVDPRITAKLAEGTTPAPKKTEPEGPRSRGWVDDAVDDILKAQDDGADFSTLPHDTQAVIADVMERPEGQRAKEARELNHIKAAHEHAKRHFRTKS